MRDEVLRVIGAVVVGLIIILGLLAGVQMLSISPIWSEQGATWVGAVGTVATLAGTIWLATTESRRRRKEELERAYIVAAALAPRISQLRMEISAVEGSLSFKDLETDSHRTPSEEADSILSSAYRPATSDELILLTPLGDNCANKLAYAQAQLDVFKALMTLHIESCDNRAAPLKEKVAAIWLEWMGDVGDRFSIIERQLVAIARIHATPPTSEELYGPDID
jgi:hypothetical protein